MQALAAAGVEAEVRSFPAGTRTAQDAAAAVGVEVGQIVKSLVFARPRSGRALLVLVSGANRADEALLAREAGEAVGRADADFVRRSPGLRTALHGLLDRRDPAARPSGGAGDTDRLRPPALRVRVGCGGDAERR